MGSPAGKLPRLCRFSYGFLFAPPRGFFAQRVRFFIPCASFAGPGVPFDGPMRCKSAGAELTRKPRTKPEKSETNGCSAGQLTCGGGAGFAAVGKRDGEKGKEHVPGGPLQQPEPLNMRFAGRKYKPSLSPLGSRARTGRSRISPWPRGAAIPPGVRARAGRTKTPQTRANARCHPWRPALQDGGEGMVLPRAFAP